MCVTEIPTQSLAHRAAVVASDIKLSHTAFAMPFALLTTFMAAGWAHRLPRPTQLGLIVLCMFLARTMAMTVNRWADRHFDAENPRTAERALPSGRLNASCMLAVAIICAIGFIVACGGFWLLDRNPWPITLAPLVLGYLAGYSYTKRFTWACHLYLGAALALSPIAAVIAIEPNYLSAVVPLVLALVVIGWVAGFDIVYALQDIDVDRQSGLHSIPSRLGPQRALWVARILHAAAAVGLLGLWYLSPQLAELFLLAVGATIGLLVLEHALVWGSRTNHISIAFLTINGLISLLLGAAGIADVIRA